MWVCVAFNIWWAHAAKNGRKKKRKEKKNTSKVAPAQCSFCYYNESHPPLSPTHICKIINTCQSGLLWPAFSLRRALWLAAPAHFLRAWQCWSSISGSNKCNYNREKASLHCPLCSSAALSPSNILKRSQHRFYKIKKCTRKSHCC